MVSAILLAAGSSRRMAPRNKLLLPWNGKPLVSATAENILAAGIDELVVVTGHEAAGITAALSYLPARFVHNAHYASGMTGSIQAGVGIANGDGYMICLGDMALIEAVEYSLLENAFRQRYERDDRCILLPEYKGEKGNPVIFARAWRSAILSHPEEEGCRTLVRGNPGHHHPVSMPTAHILQDIDSPGDYDRLILPSRQN